MTTNLEFPVKIKISNVTAGVQTVAIYREDFAFELAAGKAIEFAVETLGQYEMYAKQSKGGIKVEVINNYDVESADLLVIETPAVITLTNTGKVPATFVPYRETFGAEIAVGDSLAFTVKHVGQVLYYLAQASEGLSVAEAAKE